MWDADVATSMCRPTMYGQPMCSDAEAAQGKTFRSPCNATLFQKINRVSPIALFWKNAITRTLAD